MIKNRGKFLTRQQFLEHHTPTTTTMKASTSSAGTTAPAHNAPLPPTASSAGRSSRIAPHSHIKGLGVSPEGYANLDGAGFIGQTNAREVCHALLSLFFFAS